MAQKIDIQFFDPADANQLNLRFSEIRKIGVYTGGYLTKVSDSQISVSNLVCEISDGTYQIKCKTDAAELVTVSIAAPYVVLRWLYTGHSSDLVQFLGVASPVANDLVVGQCLYTGSILSGFDYTLRSIPNIADFFLRVIPTIPASMQVRILPGKINYGIRNYDVIDQISSVFTAPSSLTRIDALYIDSDGIVKILPGAEGAGSAANYAGRLVIAEITLTVGMTTITAASIKDVRSFLSGNMNILSLAGNTLKLLRVNVGETAIEYVVDDSVKLTGAQVITGVKTFANVPIMPGFTLSGNGNFGNNQAIGVILENRTNDSGCTQLGRIWFRTDV
jgi:hypothetical protein